MNKIDKTEVTAEEEKAVQKKPWYKQKKCIIMLVAIIALLIFNLNYTLVAVVGPSMEPNYNDANFVLAERHYNYIQRFDVVVLYSNEAQKTIIKRVIGLPGETVEYKDNQLYINGELIEDRYNYGGTSNFNVTLDNNSYFCLGDNRQVSADSRKYGDFDEDEIFAKVIGRKYVSIGDMKKVLDK